MTLAVGRAILARSALTVLAVAAWRVSAAQRVTTAQRVTATQRVTAAERVAEP